MRRAEWRVRGDDPKTLFGWWWRGIVEEDRLFGFQLLALSGAMLSWAMGFPGALAMMAAGWLGAKLLRRRDRPDRLAALLPDPPPFDQIRASVAYCRDGMEIGADDVAITIVEGWLYAEGARSHFAVRPDDVWPFRTFSDRTAEFVLADGTEVRLSGVKDAGRMDLERWHRQRREMVGTPTFPPIRVHPQSFARWWSYVVVGSAVTLTAFLCPWAATDSLLWTFIRYGGGFCGMLLLLMGLHSVLHLKIRDRSARREITIGPASLTAP